MSVKVPSSKLRFDSSKSDKYFLYDEEKTLWTAFLSHMKIVEALECAELYDDAVYMIKLATECLLKHTYCLARKELFEIESPKKINSDWNNYLIGKAIDSKISARRFEHDVRSIAEFLYRFVDFPKESEVLFETFKNNLPSDGKWINLRYGRRDHLKMKDAFLEFKVLLKACLDDMNIFKGIDGYE